MANNSTYTHTHTHKIIYKKRNKKSSAKVGIVLEIKRINKVEIP